MAPLRSVVALVSFSALLGTGCAVRTPERRMVPDMPTTVQQEVGYDDAVRLSRDYAVTQGYEVSEVAEATQVRPNYWRVRFGLAPRGSGRLLDLSFDAEQRRVVGATELGDTATGGSGPGDTGGGPGR
ncbi:putative lipoprotein [Cystobacter fuscus DSM 2262]|uniref:Lipoprotein n=1 Tax=Cystobacter fuscus (strain ATCC 25194 / DSM 2262 / NBRC 100088 / M29) TaxID=1242864 RepID=S9PEU8_CYSF2|nr:hypothetical protein [Cystobacter fuscus]EPX60892.1 putative lipoprotein [Cystobacter fuscus DSM 2262]